MRKLSWWFRVTGVVYIVLGVTWLPFINAPKLDAVIPGFDGPVGGTAYNGFLDWLVMFALEMLVVGAFLIYASFAPAKHLSLVWLVIALELVRGIVDDVYMIAAGYPVASNVVFIVLHALIIVTGVLAARAAQTQHRAAQTSSNPTMPAVSQAT
jgi:hypothetical protein